MSHDTQAYRRALHSQHRHLVYTTELALDTLRAQQSHLIRTIEQSFRLLNDRLPESLDASDCKCCGAHALPHYRFCPICGSEVSVS